MLVGWVSARASCQVAECKRCLVDVKGFLLGMLFCWLLGFGWLY